MVVSAIFISASVCARILLLYTQVIIIQMIKKQFPVDASWGKKFMICVHAVCVHHFSPTAIKSTYNL